MKSVLRQPIKAVIETIIDAIVFNGVVDDTNQMIDNNSNPMITNDGDNLIF